MRRTKRKEIELRRLLEVTISLHVIPPLLPNFTLHSVPVRRHSMDAALTIAVPYSTARSTGRAYCGRPTVVPGDCAVSYAELGRYGTEYGKILSLAVRTLQWYRRIGTYG